MSRGGGLGYDWRWIGRSYDPSGFIGPRRPRERIVITDHGQPVAVLTKPTPAEMIVETDVERKSRLQAVIAAMRKARDEGGPTLGPDLTIQQLRDEGRG